LVNVNVSVLNPELEFEASRAGDSAVTTPQNKGASHSVVELSIDELVIDVTVEVLLTEVAVEVDAAVATDVRVVIIVAVVVSVVVAASVLVAVDVADAVVVRVTVAAEELAWVSVMVLVAVVLAAPDGKSWVTASPSPPARTTARSIPTNTLLL
jgi:hypothetical protein